MRFSTIGRTPNGRYEISATKGLYDAAPPISSLRFDQGPINVRSDILAVAAILAFGEWCSGEVVFPKPVSPEIAEAIQRYLAPVWTHVTPVELKPLPKIVGEGTFHLGFDLADWRASRSMWGQPRTSSLCVVSGSDFAGALVSPHGMIVSSNAHFFGELASPEAAVRASIAVGLMYCEMYRANTIVLPADCPIADNDLNRITTLTRGTAISVVRDERVQV